MAVAMMSVLVVILIIRLARGVVIWMNAVMMVMIMRVKSRSGHIFPHVTMQPSRRCPSKLEWNDEHDDQDDEATHGVHSTELIVSTKGSFTSWTFLCAGTRLARCSGECWADGSKWLAVSGLEYAFAEVVKRPFSSISSQPQACGA